MSLLLVLLTLVMPGCGARVAPERKVVSSPRDGAPDADRLAPAVGDSVPSDAGVATVAPHAPAAVDARNAAAEGEIRRQDAWFDSREGHNEEVRASVAHQCVTHGDTQVVHIVGAPRAQLSLVISYADGQSHGAMGIVLADDAGRYDWEVLVGPDVPDGHATVLVGSSGPDQGDRGGTAHVRFRVQSGECDES